MKRIWLVGAWLGATVAAVSISGAAVRLVGNQVSDAPTPSSLAIPSPEDAGTSPTTGTEAPSNGGTSSTTAITDPTAGSTVSATDVTSTTGSPVGATSTTAPGVTSTTAPGATPTTSPGTTATTQPSTTTTASTTTTTEAGSTTTTTAATTGPFTFQTGSQPASTVTVFCTGDDVSLSGATPAAGYSATVEKAGPDEVRVVFDPIDGGSEWEIRVKCEDGVPEEEITEN